MSFVERANLSFKMLKSNIQNLGLMHHKGIELIRGNTKRLKGQTWDVSFWDPPYKEKPESWLDVAQKITGSVIVYEHSRRVGLPSKLLDFSIVDARTYGDTKITIYKKHLVLKAGS